MLNIIVGNKTVWSFNCVYYLQTVFTNYIFNIYVKIDLSWNSTESLICHKNKPTNQLTNQPANQLTNYQLVNLQCWHKLRYSLNKLENKLIHTLGIVSRSASVSNNFQRVSRKQIEYQSWSFGLVLWHINHCWLFIAKSIFTHINSSISNNSV